MQLLERGFSYIALPQRLSGPPMNIRKEGENIEGPGGVAITLLPAILVSALLGVGLGPVTGASEGVMVFCFGDVIEQYGGMNSYTVIRIDPAIDLSLVPTRPGYLASRADAIRNLRLYMPRTYDLLVEKYDVILGSDPDREVFEIRWIEWMTDSVVEDGMDLLWLGSIGRDAGHVNLDWSMTSLAEVLPSYTSEELYDYGVFRVRVKDENEELMRALPWEDSPPLANLDKQIPKQGSSVWASTETELDWPLMTHWNFEDASVLCFASKFPNGVMPWSDDWPLFGQAMIYMVYRISGKELPGDHLLFQSLMSMFSEYEMTNSILFSVISFVEQFGGNVNDLYDRLGSISEIKSEAEGFYLNEEYESCMNLMDRTKEEQNQMMEDVMKAKDNALLWVYITEWCVVSAGFLISGIVLWSLMVKRRLYAEVGVSRLESRPR